MGGVNLIKELFVFILLAATVIFLLVILLYDFMPEETEAMSPVYTRDGTVAATIEELEQEHNEEDASSLLKSYTVDSTDLQSYERRSYDKGKANPFVDLEVEQYIVENTTTTTQGDVTVVTGSSTTTSGSAQATQNTTVSNPNSTGRFFENPTSK